MLRCLTFAFLFGLLWARPAQADNTKAPPRNMPVKAAKTPAGSPKTKVGAPKAPPRETPAKASKTPESSPQSPPRGTSAQAARPPREAPLQAPKVPAIRVRFLPGKGLDVFQPDQSFRLLTRLRSQFLYTFLINPGNASLHSLQIRRARLSFVGNAFGKHNKFKVEIALSPRDVGIQDGSLTRSPLLDCYVRFDYLRDLTLRLGQYKVPYNRQRVISSGNFQLVDRSIVNGEFNLDRDIGLDIHSKDFLGLGLLRYFLGVYVGEGHSSFALSGLGLMFIARVEVAPFGLTKDDKSEADLLRHPQFKLNLGVAYAFLDNAKSNRGILGRTPADGGTTDMHNALVDLAIKGKGFSLLAELMWRSGTRNPGQATDPSGNPIPAEAPRNGLGFFVQVGFLIPGSLFEIAARYGLNRPLSSPSSLPAQDELGIGCSYYFFDHALKLQLDFFHLWNNADFTNSQERIRLQLQVAL